MVVIGGFVMSNLFNNARMYTLAIRSFMKEGHAKEFIRGEPGKSKVGRINR